jgi:outer membrane lipoprotein SlyB
MTLGACARQISPDVHAGRAAGQAQVTQAGVIENVRLVEIQESDTLEGNKTGQLLGGLAGGVAGARFGQGVGKALASAGGAIVGAFIGSFAEQEVKRQQAFEYIVRTDNGQLLTIVQGLQPQMTPGQRVYVQDGGYGRGRVIPAT